MGFLTKIANGSGKGLLICRFTDTRATDMQTVQPWVRVIAYDPSARLPCGLQERPLLMLEVLPSLNRLEELPKWINEFRTVYYAHAEQYRIEPYFGSAPMQSFDGTGDRVFMETPYPEALIESLHQHGMLSTWQFNRVTKSFSQQAPCRSPGR